MDFISPFLFFLLLLLIVAFVLVALRQRESDWRSRQQRLPPKDRLPEPKGPPPERKAG
jgi:hypothetical protein